MKILFVLMTTLFAMPALAGFQGYNSSTDLKNFSAIKCSTGLTCTKDKDKFVIVSSPTISTGALTITGAEAGDAYIKLQADESDDSGDDWAMKALASDNSLAFQNDTSGSLATKLSFSTAGVIKMLNNETIDNSTDDTIRVTSEDNDMTFQVMGFEAKDAVLQLWADEGDDAADKYSITSDASTNSLTFKNNTTSLGGFSSAGDFTGNGVGSLSGFIQKQVNATATTISASQCGSTFVNTGAVVINLPNGSAALIGCRLTFITGNASNFDINPGNSDQIILLTDAAGDAIRNATVGNVVTLQYFATNKWASVSTIGTWSDVN